MKKNLLSLTLCLLASCFFNALNAQAPIYQLQNMGFEEWYRETSNANSIVPVGFNSFYSGSGSLIGMAQDKRQDSVRDVRPGSTGTYSLYLFSTTALGFRANGNVTTGRINAAGSLLQVDDDPKHNYTDYAPNTSTTPHNPPKFMPELTGTPDSLRFWVKYLPGRTGATNTTDKGRIRVYIHGTGPCRDAAKYPSGMIETQLYYGKAVGEFFKEDGEWRCYQVPFEYTGTNTQKNANGNYYVLLSMTTNATPGGGANNPDRVWFDDVEFVYSAWLNDLRVNGVTIDEFSKNILVYGGPKLVGSVPYSFPYQPEQFSWTTESNNVKSVNVANVLGPGGDADGGYTSFLITAQDGVTTKEYRIYYFAHLSNNNTITGLNYTLDDATPILIPGVTPSTLIYTVNLADPDETRVPKIRAEDVTLSDPTASIHSISQPTAVYNSQAKITIRAEDYSLKTYTVNFSKPISSNKNLNWIRIAGIDIPDFHPDILEYSFDITTCVTANSNIPTVTYETSSIWATASYTAATTTTRMATIVVTAQDGTQRVYTINFVFKNNNANVTTFRYGTSSTNQITTQAGIFVYVSAYNFTSAPGALTPTTLGCSGATYTREPANNVFYPDTNYYHITAQDGFTKQTYKIVIKNTNCYLATGLNTALRYNYNGLVNQNTGINITTTNNGNLNPVTTSTVTTPAGPNVPAELVVYGLAAAANAAPPTVHIQQPTSRADVAVVTLTANDGVTQKVYNVPFNFTLSTDASLSNITWNGKSIEGFTSTNTTYTVGLDASVTEVPEIIGIPTFQWLPAANIVITPAEDLFGTTTIVVTAEDGIVTRTYYVEFTVLGPDNAYLSSLGYKIGGVNYFVPNFRPTTFEYDVDIAYTAPAPQLFGTPMSPGASLFPTLPGDLGKMLVISENMMGMKIYTINFNRVKNTNAALADIQINGISLQDFNSQVFDYSYELPYTELSAPIVTATSAYEYAVVVIAQIDTIMGTVIITVTAEDETFTEVYTIEFTRELSPVKAIDAIIYEYDNETYTFAFPANETEVTIMLPIETLEVPFISDIIIADHRSTFEIDEQPDETNDFTGIVVITAEDATDETYYIVFERTLSPSTLLTGIYYDDILVPNFDPAVLTYHIMLEFDHSQIPNITATAAWQGTNVETQNPSNPFGNGTVTVTSEDGENIVTYTIIFHRKGSALLAGLSYNLDGTNYPVPDFSPTTFVYNILLPIATTAIPELVYIPEDDRCEMIYIGQDAPNGTSHVTLITWTLDDSVTYTVHFTVDLSTEALLSDLQVDGVTIPNFNPNTFHYVIPSYAYGTETFPFVTATATQPDAWIDPIVQITEYPGVVSIKVYAGDVTITNTYTVAFSVNPGNNTYLEMIYLDDVPLYGFNKDVYFYSREFLIGTPQAPFVTATLADTTSKVNIYQTQQIGDTVNIYVTALNGDVALYQIYFFIDERSNNAYASVIYVDWKPLEGFERWQPDYEVFLPYGYVGLPQVAVIKDDPNATYIYNYWLEDVFPPQWQTIIMAENEDNTFTYTITFHPYNSISSYDNETEIQIYPNPSSDKIHFVIDEMIQTGSLEIYSIEGKKIGNYNLHGGINVVNIEHLQKGMYFYKISTDQTIIGTGKFVKN